MLCDDTGASTGTIRNKPVYDHKGFFDKFSNTKTKTNIIFTSKQ